jgi:hypothetical protein
MSRSRERPASSSKSDASGPQSGPLSRLLRLSHEHCTIAARSHGRSKAQPCCRILHAIPRVSANFPDAAKRHAPCRQDRSTLASKPFGRIIKLNILLICFRPAFPALNKPLRMLLAPLCNGRLGAHHALHERLIRLRQQTLIPASVRLRQRAYRQNKFDHSKCPSM